MGAVVVERERIDDAAAREGQARLALRGRESPRRAPSAQRMRGRRREPASSRPATSAGVDRAVGDAARRRLDLDQRLQPEQAARAVADDLDARGRGSTLPLAERRATSSAPTASAPASRGHEDAHGSSLRLARRSRRAAPRRAGRSAGRRASPPARSRRGRGNRPARA